MKSSMNWQEQLKRYSETAGLTEGTSVRKPETLPPPVTETMPRELMRAKADYEDSVRLVSAYFEICIRKPEDGVAFLDAKNAQDPKSFADIYTDNLKKITADTFLAEYLAGKMEVAALFPRAVEALLWQAQKDYEIFGPHACVTPTADIVDYTAGVDHVLEIPAYHDTHPNTDPDMLRLGVDVTMKTNTKAKAHWKFPFSEQERGALRHQGVFRHLDYLRTPTFSGAQTEPGTGRVVPGIDIPLVVLSLTEQDLFDYCRIVMDPKTKKPRDPKQVQQDPRFQEFRAKLFELLGKGIEEQRAEVQKQEDVFRAHQRFRIHTQGVQGELAVYEKDGACLDALAQRMAEELLVGKKRADIVELRRNSTTPEETAVLLENAAAAIRSNQDILKSIVGRLKESFSPKLDEEIERIAQKEKDKEKRAMIEELLSGIPFQSQQQAERAPIFSPLNSLEYRENSMLITGLKSVMVERAQKQGDPHAADLLRHVRGLKTTEDIVRGFEKMMGDMKTVSEEKKTA